MERAEIRAELAKGHVLKAARLCKVGTGTVQRIKNVTVTNPFRDGINWTAIRDRVRYQRRLIGGPLDWLLTQSHWTASLDGFTNAVGAK